MKQKPGRNLYIPAWLIAIMGERERAIAEHPAVRLYFTDIDGERLGPFQRRVQALDNHFTFDSSKRKIIG